MEDDAIILSDSDEDTKPFGTRSKKRKLESDSEDEYKPPSLKKTKKVKSEKKPAATEKPKKRQVTPKEKKPRAPKAPAAKRAPRKPKAVKGENELPVENEAGCSNSTQFQDEGTDFKGLDRMEWKEEDMVSEMEQIELWIARNIIRLFDEDNTIPFIARYRKEMTNDMSPEKLRDVKDSYEMVKSIKAKAATVMKNIAKLGKLTPYLERCIRGARSLNELDHIYSPFKPGSKNTLAERARQLGLEDAANAILTGSRIVYIEQLVNPEKKGLQSVKEVELGLQHIIADVISKDRGVLDFLHRMKEDAKTYIETTKARATKEPKNNAKNVKKEAGSSKDHHKDKVDVESKFENYFKFSMPVKYIKPHQVLAVNRGENLKVLSVKINIPDWVLRRLTNYCYSQWFCKGIQYPIRSRILDESIKDAYARLIQPLLVRQVRSELTKKAEHAAVEVFATNLKKLLLSPPFRGQNVLGIDPGYRNGCKIGVTSHTGNVLAMDVIYPRFGCKVDPHSDPNAFKLKDMLTKYKCEVIALGNGTACRETETYLSELIQYGWFAPLDVKFTIISEQGASIYSCSPVARKEFPDTDPNTISAVSLARRLQDPLAELVKVEPKHLGVGMYQHDVPEKQLSATLDEVVVECVSFVGVDVNTASDCLLRRIAGLNSSRAEKIIEWRSANGSFINRHQLKKVKGIGAKTFEQCAGFIRIIPETIQKGSSNFSGSSQSKKTNVTDDDGENPLDRTWIHPESYSVAMKFISKCDVKLEDLGKPHFIEKVNRTVRSLGLQNLAAELNVPEALMKLISEGLQQTPEHDLRAQFQEPLFRRGVTSMEDIQTGAILTGRVQNVTHFGSFVDIGVGQDGLIPQSRLHSVRPQLGDRVEVKVYSVDLQRRRITLDLVKIL
ncbi:S1 RNA-binding domain-containing protein 1 [Periplaneta americana]|uniref:S1 RNA-binding domain-containing protein 1 n=1 Tax=Periplaneta americana TaxID=6978 RepID=UPI0037E91223